MLFPLLVAFLDIIKQAYGSVDKHACDLLELWHIAISFVLPIVCRYFGKVRERASKKNLPATFLRPAILSP